MILPKRTIRMLWDGIGEYNFSQTGLKGQAILVFLRDDQRQRGWGTRILQATEAEAIKKGCQHSRLETYSFQALGFYQKNGYRVFSELGNVVEDHRLYF